jgi:hypothetical protein
MTKYCAVIWHNLPRLDYSVFGPFDTKEDAERMASIMRRGHGYNVKAIDMPPPPQWADTYSRVDAGTGTERALTDNAWPRN